MAKINRRKATDEEKANSQQWEVWESGDVDRFEYQYDQSVHFIVQAGRAIIFGQDDHPVAIEPGDHVTIEKGFDGIWEISSAIVNRYEYLT
ncbi:Unknown protein sequence [Pseudomonas caricapapayae]|uniref:(S)-ureidoglycine aminohydrolase cupin domain-containing protein n=1 Tax=Pseudomonas caricapapayae TaxID=46678 RepID=A0A0P9MCB6_9PSED|nr:cupin domain-containing protein [Pseudomonas caricapapayae]KAA8696568.1 cupin domain-containing protein [Pseudomonas caricapapayae]KPW55575.1 Unknown protein sequence [Pseudomonas caricapapayae]RMM04643.1 hypothetical protein ALQ84_02161 [Pseudomonas caricapapayae]RMV78919.1 hypothetical protein ALP05_03250 [Pseudomonas caricapapayae]RMW01008.1 hypothetical protein ALP01_01803 [Pseudomonas caricapapayae]